MRPAPGNATVRPPAVAGAFYPADPGELRAVVAALLDGATARELPTLPKALIVPHAGYVYSGETAAVAYGLLRSHARDVRRVVMVGPAHRIPLQGMAVPEAAWYATPLGTIAVDEGLKTKLLQSDHVVESDWPHALEHSLEVQLPFLQQVLGAFTLLPLAVGTASAAQVAAVLEMAWGGPETLIVASSDLSHYHRYDAARMIDASTCASISAREAVSDEQACGAAGINGLMHVARSRTIEVVELARCNSGDTAGDRARVVGYAAFALCEPRVS